MWTIEKTGGRRAGSGRERALPADPACRPLAFSIVLTVLTESLEQAIATIASYADNKVFQFQFFGLVTQDYGRDGRPRKEDCVTNPKNVCEGGRLLLILQVQ